MKFPLASVLLLASIPIAYLINEPTKTAILILIFIVSLISLAIKNVIDYLVYRDITSKFGKEKKL